MSLNSPKFPPNIIEYHLFHKAIMLLKWNNKYESQHCKVWHNITGAQQTRAYCLFALYSEDHWSQSLYSTQFQTSFIHIISFPQMKAHLEHRFSNQIKLYHLWLKLDTLLGIPMHSEIPVALWKNLRVPGNIVRKKPSPIGHTEGSVCVPQCWAESPLFFLPPSLPLFPLFLLLAEELRTLHSSTAQMSWWPCQKNENGFHLSVQEFLEILLRGTLNNLLIWNHLNNLFPCFHNWWQWHTIKGAAFVLHFHHLSTYSRPYPPQIASLSNCICELGRGGYSRWRNHRLCSIVTLLGLQLCLYYYHLGQVIYPSSFQFLSYNLEPQL